MTVIYNHGYILPESVRKDKGSRAKEKKREQTVRRRRTTKSGWIRLTYYLMPGCT
jgi:hypothetical protein